MIVLETSLAGNGFQPVSVVAQVFLLCLTIDYIM